MPVEGETVRSMGIGSSTGDVSPSTASVHGASPREAHIVLLTGKQQTKLAVSLRSLHTDFVQDTTLSLKYRYFLALSSTIEEFLNAIVKKLTVLSCLRCQQFCENG